MFYKEKKLCKAIHLYCLTQEDDSESNAGWLILRLAADVSADGTLVITP